MTSDGTHVWFADRAGYIGRIDGAGHLTEWTVPASAAGASPNGLVVADGIVWFTDSPGNRIGRLDPSTGAFTMYDVPTADGWPLGITVGPDGNIWFVERSAAIVARMTPDGTFTEWPLVDGAFPNRIVVGPDGALWFTELRSNQMGRITTSGHLTEFPVAQAPADAGGPVGITVGPDGALYAALFKVGGPDYVARFDEAGNVTRAWPAPGALIVASSQGAVWATDAFADTVTRIRTQCPPA
jgi:virginiamycin B lyase